VSGEDYELVQVKLYLTREQRRWLKQRALDMGSNASEVARGVLQPHVATPATVIPTPLGTGHEEVPS
jgi:hypothetical protein